MVRVYMLPAGKGDFFIIAYGHDEDIHYIVIDGGDLAGYQGYMCFLKSMVREQKKIDAVILTHNDDDHLIGAMKAWSNVDQMPQIGQIYMNTGKGIQKRFLTPGEFLLPEEEPKEYIRDHSAQHSTAHALSMIRLLSDKGLSGKLADCVCAGDVLPVGGAELKVISPGKEQLERYLRYWQESRKSPSVIHGRQSACEKRALSSYVEMDCKKDQSVPNGASIAFLFEYEDCRLAFLGDAYPEVCVQGLKSFYREPVKVDLIKVPHHGSERNYSEELYEWLDSGSYLLSTKGTAKHPSPVMLGKLFRKRPNAQILCSANWMTGYGFVKEDYQRYLMGDKPQIRVIPREESIKENLTVAGLFP